MSDGELRKIYRAHLKGGDLLAIETGGTTGGVPDTNWCRDGVEIWIENKACDHWRVAIRPAQVGWIERRLRCGGRVFIAVRRAGTEFWLFHGSMIRRLVDERVDDVPCLGNWDGGAARWDWGAIVGLLSK
jgi:hypothetical protein